MVHPNIRLHLGDSLKAMKDYPDNYWDLACVDPPYGISINHNIGRRKGDKHSGHKKVNWDNEPPTNEYFTELFRVSKNQIIWGGNYFSLPPTKCLLVWDKLFSENVSFSMYEFAWTSFESVPKGFLFNPNSSKNKIHPTQKPVALYKWLLKNYAKPNDKILDTHGGSMSIAIACHDMGFDLDLWELDEDYYKAGKERFETHIKQQQLFSPKEIVTLKQSTLL